MEHNNNALTNMQLAALISFARENGRTWKSQLRSAWATGNYAPYENAPVLQTIRNVFGPSWLCAFNLKRAVAARTAELDAQLSEVC